MGAVRRPHLRKPAPAAGAARAPAASSSAAISDANPDGLEWRAPYWYAVFYDAAGARQRRSTRCRLEDADRALALRAQWEADARDPHHRAAATTLRDVLSRFVSGRDALVTQGKRSAATIRYYLQKAGVLRGFFERDANDDRNEGLFAVADLTTSHIDGYIDTRRNDGVDDTSIKKELAVLRAGLKAAKRRGEFSGDLDVLFTLPDDFDPKYRPRKRVLTRDQLGELIARLPANRAAQVTFIVATSCELGALLRARPEDVVRGAKKQIVEVHIRGTKRETRDRHVPIVTDDQIALMRFTMQHADGTEGLLFGPWSNIRRDLVDAVAEINEAYVAEGSNKPLLPRISPNDLRRTAGSWLRAEGIALDHIAKVMGHRTSKMVELVYGQLTTAELGNLMRRSVGKAPSTNLRSAAKATGRAGSSKAMPKQTASGMRLSARPATRPRNPAPKIRVSTKTLPDKLDSTGRFGPSGRRLAARKQPIFVPRGGIEPSTRGFSIRCSTN